MNFYTGALIFIGLLFFTALSGAGCRTLFRDAEPAAKIKIAARTELNQNWTEIAPPAPLAATGKIHFVALKLNNAQGWADGNKQKIRFADGSDVEIEIELIDEKGGATALFPNGFGEFVEFGKRAADRETPGEAYFQTGQRFSRLRLRSDKPVTAEEIVWTEFEF